MRKVFSILIATSCLLLNETVLYAQGHHMPYAGYVAMNKEFYGISVCFPETMVKQMPCKEGSDMFFFGLQDESKTWPNYLTSLSVRLESHCILFLQDSMSIDPGPNYHTKSIDTSDKNKESPFTAIMLNNCDLPYTYWYSYKDPKKEQIETAKRKYITYISDKEVLGRANADEISVVKIPYIRKVMIIDNTDYNVWAHAYFDSCYGITFSRAERGRNISFLAFVAELDDVGINDYVDMMSRYISFDKDFVLE